MNAKNGDLGQMCVKYFGLIDFYKIGKVRREFIFSDTYLNTKS